MAEIIVFGQIEDGVVLDGTLQCLATARCIAAGSGDTVAVAALGSDIAGLADGLIARGADKVYLADDPALAQFVTGPYKRVLKDLLAAQDVRALLLPATTTGDDLAPVLAAEAGLGCVMHCDSVEADGDALKLKRLEYDRKVMTAYRVSGCAVLTLKDGAADPLAKDAGRSGETVAVSVSLDEADMKSTIARRDVTAKSINLKDANIIVAAGAGVGNADNFATVKELADKLGAELGATRAVCDAGWLPADHQIGQTGAVVKPDLYIAVGISGAVQHWVGMSDAKTIVAVNVDKNAPLMKRAHYRIVGDLSEVVPKLIKLI